MVECTRRPSGDGVTGSALRRRRRKSGRHVIRDRPANRRGAKVYSLVATVTIRRT